LLGTLAFGVPADAAIYDSGGFEAFSNGDLVGQDPANGPWVKAGPAGSTATVQTTVKQAGQKAVQVVRQASSSGDARFAVVKPLANVTTPITIDWDMNYTQSTVPAGSFGPFFGVEAYDGLNNAPLLAGSLGVDAKTGEVLYQQADTGNFLVVPALTLSPGVWNHFQLQLDYAAETYSIFVIGVFRGSETFVDPGIFDFTDAPLAALAAAGDAASLAAGGTAYFDNYVVNGVPEPTVAWFGSLGLVLSRRNRRVRCG
jgi:hypothetical protein